MASDNKSQFEKVAKENKSIIGEFIDYLKANKKWWLLPIITTLVLIGVLLLLSTTAAAPFIYTLF